MKTLTTLSLFAATIISCYSSLAQTSASGQIDIPRMHSITPLVLDEKPIDFSSISDYKNGVIISEYCKILVKSNYAWKLNARFSKESAGNTAASKNLVSVRVSGSKDFIPLSTTPTTIQVSNNDNISNEYYIDLKIDPKLGVNANLLLLNIDYTLAAQ